MIARIVGPKPGGRLQTGAAILAGAEVIDCHWVEPRLRAFAGAHGVYVDAQRQVDAAHAVLGQCDSCVVG